MERARQFYIGGEWVQPHGRRTCDVLNPASEEPLARITLGDEEDVNRAVSAAQRAFPAFSRTSAAERAALLGRIIAAYRKKIPELAATLSEELGAPLSLAKIVQAPAGLSHLTHTLAALNAFVWERDAGRTRIVQEPIGVCALITPWNWPLNEIAAKVAPALAAGCTMLLKPSEVAPLSALLFAEIMHDAGVPPGVFNLVNGDGDGVGVALSRHPDVALVSFTGSTRAASPSPRMRRRRSSV